MNTLKSVADGRDPVAFAIQEYLHLVEQDGVYSLSIKQLRSGSACASQTNPQRPRRSTSRSSAWPHSYWATSPSASN